MEISLTAETRFLQRPEGRIAYTVHGDGPLVIAVPGMGDLAAGYRDVVGPLVAAGYRVALTELRGHGDSDTSFTSYGDAETGGDLLALIDELGGPAVAIGNSMGGSAAIWAAAERPDAVAGLVGISPFVRNPPMPAIATALLHGVYRVLFAGPWGAGAWAGYYVSLNRGRRADWLPEHRAALAAALRRPGRLRAFRELTLQLDHAIVEAIADRVDPAATPSVVLIGDGDPDYRDPAAELEEFARRLGSRTVLVAEAGHYAQAQQPEIVVRETLALLATALPTGGTDA
ncbi:alpha/beta fold hydrolase [Schumannella sp. 10F1B-5-1]|uniref:alpha/beta fold hydrolase n=1 Tax=Schumannella sp. 10F1B-5-1 TaxID=2590780 RepID=UPI001131D5ED|nr:alpha/beta hydrolase [Schumannella sp. 10F1B-5-1]TPW70093.1 alpha/beta hydrolase [Schumannella sp. 10F1B-5-1]